MFVVFPCHCRRVYQCNEAWSALCQQSCKHWQPNCRKGSSPSTTRLIAASSVHCVQYWRGPYASLTESGLRTHVLAQYFLYSCTMKEINRHNPSPHGIDLSRCDSEDGKSSRLWKSFCSRTGLFLVLWFFVWWFGAVNSMFAWGIACACFQGRFLFRWAWTSWTH